MTSRILTIEEFFGLSENPFKDNLDERFYYTTRQHEKTFASMLYCITNKQAVGLIVGASGTGKSMISYRILSFLKDKPEYKPGLILVNPQMPKTSLLKEVARELGLDLPAHNMSTQDLIDLITNEIIRQYKEDRRIILIIDEAHFLSSEALHMVRTLTNLETPQEKLVSCILIAEARFLTRLLYKTYDSLRSRIKTKAQLVPLNEEETKGYILHRLNVVGRNKPLFEEDTFALIHQKSHGICRQVNKIAGQCLFEACFDEKPVINLQVLNESLSNLEGLL